MKITPNSEKEQIENLTSSVPAPSEVESVRLTKENWPAIVELVGIDAFTEGTVVGGVINPEHHDQISWGLRQRLNEEYPDWPICLSMEIDDAIMVAHEGDWIIKNAEGKLDFQTDEAFNGNFEPAE